VSPAFPLAPCVVFLVNYSFKGEAASEKKVTVSDATLVTILGPKSKSVAHDRLTPDVIGRHEMVESLRPAAIDAAARPLAAWLVDEIVPEGIPSIVRDPQKIEFKFTMLFTEDGRSISLDKTFADTELSRSVQAVLQKAPSNTFLDPKMQATSTSLELRRIIFESFAAFVIAGFQELAKTQDLVNEAPETSSER
jgi:hypothetical protein